LYDKAKWHELLGQLANALWHRMRYTSSTLSHAHRPVLGDESLWRD